MGHIFTCGSNLCVISESLQNSEQKKIAQIHFDEMVPARIYSVNYNLWSRGRWDHVFESRSRHGCLSASFCVMLFCVGRGLATGRSSVQGVLRNVEKRLKT
jgi:hypothetical protein